MIARRSIMSPGAEMEEDCPHESSTYVMLRSTLAALRAAGITPRSRVHSSSVVLDTPPLWAHQLPLQ